MLESWWGKLFFIFYGYEGGRGIIQSTKKDIHLTCCFFLVKFLSFTFIAIMVYHSQGIEQSSKETYGLW